MIFTGDNKEITRIMTGDGKEIIEVRDGQGRIIYQTAVDMLGDSPLLFQGKGKPLSQYKIWGNSYQDGVPDPEHPVEVVSVGDLVMSGEHAGEYVIPVTVSDGTNTQTYPIYLSEPLRKIGDYADEIDFKAGTVTRRIREVVLTGAEKWAVYNVTYYMVFAGIPSTVYYGVAVCNRFLYRYKYIPLQYTFSKGANENLVFNYDNSGKHLNDFKAWLSQLYADGNPMIVYHALLNPTTEPITLPTIAAPNGTNTLSIDTALPPSQLSITGRIKPSPSYGKLLDSNNVLICDKNGIQLKVIG